MQVLIREDIYQNERVTKSRAYLITQRAPGIYGLFNAIDKGLHQRKRKLCTQVLNERAMRAHEPVIIAQINIFLQKLLLSHRQQPSNSLNMTQLFRYLTLDIMGHVTFAYPLNLQTETTHRTLVESTSANFLLNIAMQLPSISQLRIWTFRPLRASIRGRDYLQALHKMMKHCLSKGQHVKRDLMFLSDSFSVSEDDHLWFKEILSETIFFLSAG